MNELFQIILQSAASAVIVIGALVGLAPTKLGDGFLNHFFDRKLAAQRHDYETQVEKLRASLAHLGDRGIRSNEREFEALTSSWERFVDAWLSTNACAMEVVQYPDLNGATDEEVENFLASSDLSESQRRRVYASPDRNHALLRFLKINQILHARNEIFDARSILRKQGVFIPVDLQVQYEKALDILAGAQTQKYMEFNSGRDYPELKYVDRLIKDGQEIFNGLQASTRARMLHV